MLFIFFFLAAFSEAVMDTLQFHYYRSIFSSLNPIFWNPKLSWKNKYTLGNPGLGPKFVGSTTIFVFTTDGWHLFKFFRNLFLFLGIFFACLYVSSLRDAVIMTVSTRVVFGVAFTGFMKILLKD
tara:strand:- start:10 stop:384 length:375 start_codon:yes stop_codon:yes gene_type:complete